MAEPTGEEGALSDAVRRYNGSTDHAEWCDVENHEGFCLDILMQKGDPTWTPARWDDQTGKPSISVRGSES